MKKIIFTALILNSLVVNAQLFTCGDSLVDVRDGKKYATILIGSQCWMQDNLNFGTMINHTTAQSNNLVFEKYCYNDDTTNCSMYGGLYQWNEAMDYTTTEGTPGVCPEGWHLPSDNEWKTLEIFLGMSAISADSNNAFRGTDQATQLVASGSSGFDAVYAGVYHGVNQNFTGQGTYTLFWTSSLDVNSYPFRRGLYDFETRVWRGSGNVIESPLYGYCLRCVNNTATSIHDFPIDDPIKIYPIPAKEFLFIDVGTNKDISSLQIVDMLGRVSNFRISDQKNISIDVRNFRRGIYLVRVVSKDGSVFTVRKIEIID